MKIAQFTTGKRHCIGVEDRGEWIEYGKAWAFLKWTGGGDVVRPPATILDLLERGECSGPEIRKVVAWVNRHGMRSAALLERGAQMLAPLERPPKIIALGLNYELHAREGHFEVPPEPIIFMKAGSSVIGPGETIRLPRGMGRMDHEVELAVVIGKRASEVPRRAAMEYVAGYTICNDVTARDLQAADLEVKHPWFRSKSFDTFSPLGPWIVTADEIRQPGRLTVECRVNGKVRQHASTRDLVFDIPTVIEFVTRYIALDPGDVISTGTPEGIGPLRHGDTVSCRVEKIGELKNPVRNR